MTVALKVVPMLAKAGAPDLSEIRLLAKLSHPNVARLIDGGVHPKVGLYLVTEFVDGMSLRKFVDDRQLSATASLELFDTREARVFATTIGHHNVTMEDPNYQALLTRGLLWAAGLDVDAAFKNGN